jgi:hypothetical protein
MPFGNFVGDLDAHLQHAVRVIVDRVSGEEQPEIFVDHLTGPWLMWFEL